MFEIYLLNINEQTNNLLIGSLVLSNQLVLAIRKAGRTYAPRHCSHKRILSSINDSCILSGSVNFLHLIIFFRVFVLLQLGVDSIQMAHGTLHVKWIRPKNQTSSTLGYFHEELQAIVRLTQSTSSVAYHCVSSDSQSTLKTPVLYLGNKFQQFGRSVS